MRHKSTAAALVHKPYRRIVRRFHSPTGATLSYERFETVLPVSGLVCEDSVREACATCPRYGKNLSCPPASPDLRTFTEGKNLARVICIRIPQENTTRLSREELSHECFAYARNILVEELMSYRKQGYLIAGSGSCQACAVCAGEAGLDQCRSPENLIYSLESLGVNVVALAKTCFDIDLDWSVDEHAAGFICAIGAVFLDDDEDANSNAGETNRARVSQLSPLTRV